MKDKMFCIVDSSEISKLYKATSDIRNHFDEYKKIRIHIKVFKIDGGKEIDYTLENDKDIHNILEEIKKYFSDLKKWDTMYIKLEAIKFLQNV